MKATTEQADALQSLTKANRASEPVFTKVNRAAALFRKGLEKVLRSTASIH
jgi:hypothetical protein